MAGALARAATIEVADDFDIDTDVDVGVDVIDLDAELDQLIAELAREEAAIPDEQFDVPTWKIRVGLTPDWKIWLGAVALVVGVFAATVALRWYFT